jgi:ATP-dependent Clp protease ATP-binding subunit ClpB
MRIKVLVDEPSEQDTIAILRGLKEKYEVHHGVEITGPAIIAAVTYSQRYITDTGKLAMICIICI